MNTPMKYFRNIILFCALFIALVAEGRSLRFQVDAGPYDRRDCVVSFEVPSRFVKKGRSPHLYELQEDGRVPVDCQLVNEGDSLARLCFILTGQTPARFVREFVLRFEKASNQNESSVMSIKKDDSSVVLQRSGHPILTYQHALAQVPEGVDEVFRRSGFIHPAWTPSGYVLTTIQPRDHRHHYGIWNPWTRVEYDGKMYDLWNLGDRKGTVRSVAVEQTFQGDVMAGFDARLEHIIFQGTGERKIMDETWSVKAWSVEDGFLWDFESQLSPSTSIPVLLKEYRYAGFGYRANEEWTRQNSSMMTSEGYSRQQIDGTRARWIYITGTSPVGHSGLLLMGAPENYNSPEPLRIWDEQANGGRGDAFINFAPTKNTDWTLEPGQNYRLCYRLYAYDGEMTPQLAEQLWHDFAYPPVVTLKLKKP